MNRERLLQLAFFLPESWSKPWKQQLQYHRSKPFSSAAFLRVPLLLVDSDSMAMVAETVKTDGEGPTDESRGCTSRRRPLLVLFSSSTAAPWPAVSPTTPQDEEHHPKISAEFPECFHRHCVSLSHWKWQSQRRVQAQPKGVIVQTQFLAVLLLRELCMDIAPRSASFTHPIL